MAEIAVIMTGDEAKLWKAQQKILQQQMQLDKGYQRVQKAGAKAGSDAGGAFAKQSGVVGALQTKLLALVGTYMSVTQGVNLLTAALREFDRLGKKSADLAISRADAQAEVITNIGDVSDEATQKFIRNVEDAALKGKLPAPAPALSAAASILSATSGDRAKTLDILGQAIPFFRGKPEQLPEFGGSLADVMRVTQGGGKETAALLLSIFSQARFTELGAFKNVAGTLAAGEIVAPGDRMRAVRESAALVAGVGGRIADPDAAQTSTAVANLMANLQEFVPDLDTTFKRLAKVQTDPKLQEEVLAKGFRGAIKPVIRDLVSGADTQTAREVRAALEKIVAPEELVDRKRRQLESLTPELSVATFERAAAGRREEFMVGGGQGIRGAVSRQVGEALAESQRGIVDYAQSKAVKLALDAMLAAGLEPETAGAAALTADFLMRTSRGQTTEGDMGERLRLLHGMLQELRGLRQDVSSGRTAGDAQHRAAAVAERAAQRE